MDKPICKLAQAYLDRVRLLYVPWRHQKSQRMVCIDSRTLSTTVTNQCQTLRELSETTSKHMPSPLISGIAHAQFPEGLHFNFCLRALLVVYNVTVSTIVMVYQFTNVQFSPHKKVIDTLNSTLYQNVWQEVVNPRRACAARVTVVVVCVCLSVNPRAISLHESSIPSHKTPRSQRHIKVELWRETSVKKPTC